MILVTGSTGTIGARLIRRLAESGQRVRALVRPWEPDAWPAQLGIERAKIDFDDPDGLAAAARGADRVFMLVPPSAHQERWQANIVAAAQAANAGYVVKVSAFDTGATSALKMDAGITPASASSPDPESRTRSCGRSTSCRTYWPARRSWPRRRCRPTSNHQRRSA
jgi:uncharacterized protein YbjT (DUF2867 family)